MKTKQPLDARATDLPPPGCAGSPTRRSTRSAPASASLVTPEKIVANKRKDSSRHVASSHKKRKTRTCSSKLPTPRTASFSACWAGNFEQTMNNDPVQPHTLILGTHPSVASLSGNEYYAHPQNAFWWIAGDCLGFRRNTGISPKGVPYQITVELRQAHHQNILPYRNQLATLVSHGFALWDVVASCERPGSLDSDIKDEIPNDVVSFCRAHPSIRRIVFSNGGTTARLFAKHFSDWLSTGQLVPYENEASLKGLGTLVRSMKSTDGSKCDWTSSHQITLVAALSVSPAAARYTYSKKRDFWDEHVYRPGLALLNEAQSTSRYFANEAS
jgi:double-stranded uracil-DNA glycosylase